MNRTVSSSSLLKDALCFPISFAIAYAAIWSIKQQGFELPSYATWEIAALLHLFYFAWEMMDFKGHIYISKSFNDFIKKLVLVFTALILFLKLIFIFVEAKEINPDGKEPHTLIEFTGSAVHLPDYVHFLSVYIMVIPLAMFFIVNLVFLLKMKHECAQLGYKNTDAEKNLKKLIILVDIAPICLFIFMGFTFVWSNGDARSEDAAVIVVCSTLTISNIITFVYFIFSSGD